MTKFKIGQNNITYLGDNFKNWFGNMKFKEPKKWKPLTPKKLPRNMNDKEILAELKPEEVTLTDVYETLKIINKDVWALFYVKDLSGVLRTVSVHWSVGGWRVGADGVSHPHAWNVGGRVFSRQFMNQSPSDTLNLSHFETLEKRVAKLESLFNEKLIK